MKQVRTLTTFGRRLIIGRCADAGPNGKMELHKALVQGAEYTARASSTGVFFPGQSARLIRERKSQGLRGSLENVVVVNEQLGDFLSAGAEAFQLPAAKCLTVWIKTPIHV